MQHHNPLAPQNPGKKFITMGEIMLRLTPPNYEKIRMASTFGLSYGGSEANIAPRWWRRGRRWRCLPTTRSLIWVVPSPAAPSARPAP